MLFETFEGFWYKFYSRMKLQKPQHDFIGERNVRYRFSAVMAKIKV